MIRSGVILGCIMLFIAHTQAQEEQTQVQNEQSQTEKTTTIEMPRFRLGIEVGVDFLFGTINKPEQIRESQSYYYDGDYDFHCGFVADNRNFGFHYLGIKPEFLLHKKVAVTTGIRFSTNKITLNSDDKYFLWRISENETSTNYIKINSISQRNYYLGVPLEVRLFTAEKDYTVRQYFVVGTTLNFWLASNNDISFSNSAMEKYTSQLSENIGKPSFFQGVFYAGVGLKIGKMNHPCGRIEAHFPVIAYGNSKTKSFTNIINNSWGFGLQATLLIPIATGKKLTYTVDN